VLRRHVLSAKSKKNVFSNIWNDCLKLRVDKQLSGPLARQLKECHSCSLKSFSLIIPSEITFCFCVTLVIRRLARKKHQNTRALCELEIYAALGLSQISVGAQRRTVPDDKYEMVIWKKKEKEVVHWLENNTNLLTHKSHGQISEPFRTSDIGLRFGVEVYGAVILWLKIFRGKSINVKPFNGNQRNCQTEISEFSLSTFLGYIGKDIMLSVYNHAPAMFRRGITFLVKLKNRRAFYFKLFISQRHAFCEEESPNYLPQACVLRTKHNTDFLWRQNCAFWD